MPLRFKARVDTPSGHKLLLGIDRERRMGVIHVELGKPIAPSELKEIDEAAMVASSALAAVGCELLVISGRGPIWMHMAIGHQCFHKFPIVAVFDPKLRGAVVVATHTPRCIVGDVEPIEEEDLAVLMKPPVKLKSTGSDVMSFQWLVDALKEQ